MTKRLTTIVLILFLLGTWSSPAGAQETSSEQTLTILLVNDDGYDAPGLKALVEAMSPVGHLVVAAPASQQSGTGHGITYRDPIMVRRIRPEGDFPWYAIQARPATCTRLALESLMDARPDLVISGINRGENLGLATFLSGTVAAAREAAFTNVPAMAVSMRITSADDYMAAASYVRRLVRQLGEQNLIQPGLFLNVNIPAGLAAGAERVQVTRLSLKAPGNAYQRRVSPRGQVYYWNTYRPVGDDEEGTDVHAFQRGFITITPMSLDQTKTVDLKTLRRLIGNSSR